MPRSSQRFLNYINSFAGNVFNASMLYTLKALLRRNRFYFFFFFCLLLPYKIPTIFWDATLIKFFDFAMPIQKSDKNNSIRIIFIKIIIKISIIKIYTKNTHFITTKFDITKMFIKKE